MYKLKKGLEKKHQEYVSKNTGSYAGGIVSFAQKWAEQMEKEMPHKGILNNKTKLIFMDKNAKRISYEVTTNNKDGLYYSMNGLLIKDDALDIREDFPYMDELRFDGKKYDFNISLREIRNVLNVNNSKSYYHDQIYVDGKNCCVVATDGSNLYLSLLNSNLPESRNLSINCEFLRKLMNLLNIRKTEKIMISDKFVSFIFGDIVLTVTTLDKSFPNYRSVIPDKTSEFQILFDIKELKNLRDTFVGHRNCRSGCVSLKVEKKEFVFYFIHSRHESILKLKTGIKTKIKKLNIILGVNFLLKIIKIMKNGTLVHFKESDILSVENDSGEQFISTPLTGGPDISDYKKYQIVESKLKDYDN